MACHIKGHMQHLSNEDQNGSSKVIKALANVGQIQTSAMNLTNELNPLTVNSIKFLNLMANTDFT